MSYFPNLSRYKTSNGDSLKREYILMNDKIKGFSNESLKIIWTALKNYDPKEEYAPGISMDIWAQAIYSEMDRRGIPRTYDQS